MGDQDSLLGSGIALILKTGVKHSGQLIHIDTTTSSITVQDGAFVYLDLLHLLTCPTWTGCARCVAGNRASQLIASSAPLEPFRLSENPPCAVISLGSEDRPTQDGRPVPPSPHVQERVVFSGICESLRCHSRLRVPQACTHLPFCAAHEIENIEFFPYQQIQQVSSGSRPTIQQQQQLLLCRALLQH